MSVIRLCVSPLSRRVLLKDWLAGHARIKLPKDMCGMEEVWSCWWLQQRRWMHMAANLLPRQLCQVVACGSEAVRLVELLYFLVVVVMVVVAVMMVLLMWVARAERAGACMGLHACAHVADGSCTTTR
jgi:hypothetical protein